MTTPCYSRKYRLQVDLKGLCLPVTITIPDIPDTTPGNDDLSGSLIGSPIETHCVASGSTSCRLSIATQNPEDAQALVATTDSPDIDISFGDQLDLLSGLGITLRIKPLRRAQLKFRWFHMQGTTPLSNPSNIRHLDRVDFRPFDVFLHIYCPDSSDSTTRLWVWEPLQSSGSSETCSWKSVGVGYICPGPGFLQGRYLVVSDQREPGWVSGSTRYRRYK
ncbi:hypothetical protein BJY52DRAFT_1212648 [Lactarius psammicola]|nr:hypothetical protein BJY52DRAFT_1212648 [Lactarius psammicola]